MRCIHGLLCWFIIFECCNRNSASSVHKPKLSQCASWNSNEIIVAAKTFSFRMSTDLDVFNSYNAFIDINDTLYITEHFEKVIQILPEKTGLQKKNITIELPLSFGLFVTSTGDIYLDHGYHNQVTKRSVKNASSTIVMYINGGCNGSFVAIDHTLYCSIENGHQVIKMPLDSNGTLLTTAAGTGCAGSASDMLNQPFGIYVDDNLDLYVADTGNDRIQLFRSGKLNGTTVAGQQAVMSFTLNQPTSVILDADGFLFIADSGSQRIIRSRSDGFQCIIGCSIQACSKPFCHPLSVIFASNGNIYVTNQNKTGVQKYVLSTNSCDETSISPMQTSTVQTIHFTTNSIVNQTCIPPMVKLFPQLPDTETPLRFRRSQDFYITAMIKLTCADSLGIEIKWSIFNCTPNCSMQANIDPSINTKFSELYFPARSLIYGLYQLKLTVTMVAVPNMATTVSTRVEINPSGITANLVQFGTSLVTSGQERDLLLDPGVYSSNPDESSFNASDWTYEYQCRLYNSTYVGRWSSFNEKNNPCFVTRAGNIPAWQYNPVNASQSSVTILAGSLKCNHTYQFVVFMLNRRNVANQATGYVLVKVEDTRPQMIAVACVISTMCSANQAYQYINPSTQVALFSDCVGKCHSVLNIHWNIYQGLNDSSTSIVNWTRFTADLHFFGINTSNFTALNTLFLNNENVTYWRFEVVYKFPNETSSSALNFIINHPPQYGHCSIYPPNGGSTSTIFTINCTEWFDEDDVKDYSFYLGTTLSEQVMLAFTTIPSLRIQLPAGIGNQSVLNITVHIRDFLNCVKEYYMEPVIVVPDRTVIDAFIDVFQNSKNTSMSNSLIQALASGDQNTVGPVVTLISQEFNKRNKQNLEIAVANGIPATSISVSALGSEVPSTGPPAAAANGSISPKYIEELTELATIRDYLMKVSTNLAIMGIDSIKLQANILAQLTKATNELTRSASMLASTKCHELAVHLNRMARRISYEDALFATNYISQCVNQVLTAVNAPLQQRGVLLDSHSINEDIDYVDYNSDLKLFLLTYDISSNEIKHDRILYYQKKAANQIAEQAVATFSFITSILNVHLNIGQKLTINSTSLSVSLETTTIESLFNQSIQQTGNAKIRIPFDFQSNLTGNASVSLRSTVQSLAPIGASQSQANTNMSTTISLTVLSQDGTEIPIHATDDQPIEFFIPRDPSVIIPVMNLQNVTSNSSEEPVYLDLKQFVINKNLTVSLHFEIQPLNIRLGYLLIYKFDKEPIMNSVKYDIDGWTLFCPANLSNKSIYTYYIDNRQAAGRNSLVFKFREFNATEVTTFCQNKSINGPPIFDEPANFTSNYLLRIYSSGCYYLDKYNNWQSDGLWVGPLTDHYQTHCFSTHLTTFTSSFRVLPLGMNENELERMNDQHFPTHSECFPKPAVHQQRCVNYTTHDLQVNLFQPSYLWQDTDWSTN